MHLAPKAYSSGAKNGEGLKRGSLICSPPKQAENVNDILYSILLKEEHSSLADEMLHRKVPLAKFTGHFSYLQKVQRCDLLKGGALLSRLVLRALDNQLTTEPELAG